MADHQKPSPQQVKDVIAEEFDEDFYSEQYPDLDLPKSSLLSHFCEVGWVEGRNPNPYFDVVSYLESYPDVAAADINPFFHYLPYGRRESRIIKPSMSPSARSRLLFGHEVADWVGVLRHYVDPDYYRSQLSDEIADKVDPAAHFAFRGWRSGLDPSARISIARLKEAYPEAGRLLVNALLVHHEAISGRYRPVQSAPNNEAQDFSAATAHTQHKAASAPTRKDLQNSNAGQDEFERQKSLVASEFDRQFYLSKYPDVASARIDPLHHFYYTGWREFRNPSPDFDTSFYLERYPDVQAAAVNPLWHFIAIGRSEGRLPAAPKHVATTDPILEETVSLESDEARINRIRKEFSAAYYLHQNPDIAAAGVDPLLHYYDQGWREGRNPNKHFDTAYYLETNEDVRSSGVNPFWHYLVAGRAEQRAARRPGGFRRRIIEAAKAPELRTEGYQTFHAKQLTKKTLTKLLDGAIATAAGVAVALSHDCYVRVVGGTQIFISDEQTQFARREFAYIQLSPRKPLLTLAARDPAFEVQIVLNGEFIGVSALSMLTALLRTKLQMDTRPCFFIIHSILGFDERSVCELREAIMPTRAVYWLHDYSTICEGYNLTRNDLQFCDAPPPESMACRVCVYGANREKHLSRMRYLFENCKFDVLAPSQFTLDFWQTKSQMPALSAEAHPHWRLKEPGPEAPPPATLSGPVKIAFVGFPTSAKGWEYFCALVDEFAEDERYKFFHFAARDASTTPECEFVVSEVTPQDRFAMEKLLRAHAIDFIAMLSPWPETFSFVAHEALAAGCQILCFADSGNVAAVTRRMDLGYVFPGFAELREFVDAPALFEATERARSGRRNFEIVNTGTTALVSHFFEEPAFT